MNNALIIPTYPKDFHWTYKLLDSASNEENILLIFSSEEDANQFNHPFPHMEKVVAPVNEGWAIPTYKKLYGLTVANSWQMDYVATVDTESLFLNPVTPCLEEIWNKNPMIANYYKDSYNRNYITQCLEACNIDNYPYPTNLYYWFNDIQVYPVKYVSEFLNWLPTNIPHHCYDYLLFTMFMIMEHGHQLRIWDTKADYGVIEDIKLYPECEKYAAETHWSAWFPNYKNYPNLKMLFHLDRHTAGH